MENWFLLLSWVLRDSRNINPNKTTLLNTILAPFPITALTREWPEWEDSEHWTPDVLDTWIGLILFFKHYWTVMNPPPIRVYSDGCGWQDAMLNNFKQSETGKTLMSHSLNCWLFYLEIVTDWCRTRHLKSWFGILNALPLSLGTNTNQI